MSSRIVRTDPLVTASQVGSDLGNHVVKFFVGDCGQQTLKRLDVGGSSQLRNASRLSVHVGR